MSDDAPAAVELRGLTKRFGSVLANDRVNLLVRPGSIHGVIGENGAGKSTAMNLLYGIYQPDAGEIFVNGARREWSSPRDAIAGGLGMVHQHFMLAGPYSALDNILLGVEPVRWGVIDRKSGCETLERLAAQYGLAVDWRESVEHLPVGIQQRVEILKLLYRRAEILILDEPTSVLTPQETKGLFENLRKLREEGKTILLVTHKLKEVAGVTDQVTVFRAGQVIAQMPTSETNPQQLADLMVGRKVLLTVKTPEKTPSPEKALEVSNLSLMNPDTGRETLSNVSFAVHRSEIVGIAGVEGNGQSELLRSLLHPRELAGLIKGSIKFFGDDVMNRSAANIREFGVAVFPEDRQREGLLPQRPLNENFLLGLQRGAKFRQLGFVRTRSLCVAAAQAVKEYDVRPADLELRAEQLSGGNQQKLVVAREFERNPRVIIAAQPTRGVDVGAIEFIHARLMKARDNGAGILLISSELDEILALSDRILVMYEGRMVAEFRRGQVSESELGLKMGGG
jgi:simple sugar transport system ATP-binding protein